MTKTKCFVISVGNEFIQISDTCSNYPGVVPDVARATFWTDEKILKSFIHLYKEEDGWHNMKVHIATINVED